MLWLTFQLKGAFFSLETDRRHSISVPGAQSVPPLGLDKEMLEVVERVGSVKVVYIDQSICIAEIEKEKEKNAKVAMDVVTAVDEKAEGDMVEVSAANNIPETS
jgi:hypothetical protein